MSLSQFIKRMKAEARSGKRHCRYTDPSSGLEYNKINPCSRVTQKIYDVDIARTPQIIRDIGENTNMHGEAWKANSHRGMVDFRRGRACGRGR